MADWYDATVRRLPLTDTATAALLRLLGPGPGRRLDLACGTGLTLPQLAVLGWRVTGVDLSGDQLRLGRGRAARVLRPGGRLLDVGTHPCFVQPFAERPAHGPILLHPGYRARGWHSHGPGFNAGIRPRVGANHLPLADLVEVFLGTGLTLRRIEEPGQDDYPFLLALVLER